MAAIREDHQRKMARHGEYQSLSIDATYKLSMKVIGQSSNQKHNIVSVVGTRGSPLGLSECRAEKPEKLVADGLESTIPHFARDRTS